MSWLAARPITTQAARVLPSEARRQSDRSGVARRPYDVDGQRRRDAGSQRVSITGRKQVVLSGTLTGAVLGGLFLVLMWSHHHPGEAAAADAVQPGPAPAALGLTSFQGAAARDLPTGK